MPEDIGNIDPAQIRRGRLMTAGYIGLVTVGGAIASAIAGNEIGPKGAVAVATVAAIGDILVGGFYYAGDGDLSPHRDQARHFGNNGSTPEQPSVT